jgi:hypothetical protein
MNTRDKNKRKFVGSTGRPVRQADILTAIRQCGILSLSQLCRPPRHVTGTVLLHFTVEGLRDQETSL